MISIFPTEQVVDAVGATPQVLTELLSTDGTKKIEIECSDPEEGSSSQVQGQSVEDLA